MNTELYNKVKTAIKKAYPVHSAYRSGLIVRTYKRLGGVYPGKKPTRTGLVRWFKEDWKSNTGKYGYTSKSSVYRPTKRVTKNTPKTFSKRVLPRVATAAAATTASNTSGRGKNRLGSK